MTDDQHYFPIADAVFIGVLHVISYYYVIHASINDGVTGFVLGIPFAVFLIVEIIKSKHFLRYLSVVILVLSCVLYFSDRSSWKLIYPMVGESLEITKEVYYRNQKRWINVFESEKDEKYPPNTFLVGTKIRVINQIFAGNPDFGVAYKYYIEVDFNGIIEKYGISGFVLGKVFKSQNIKFKKNRISSNSFVRYTHATFIYPIILLAFFCLWIVRGMIMVRISKDQNSETFIAGRSE